MAQLKALLLAQNSANLHKSPAFYGLSKKPVIKFALLKEVGKNQVVNPDTPAKHSTSLNIPTSATPTKLLNVGSAAYRFRPGSSPPTVFDLP